MSAPVWFTVSLTDDDGNEVVFQLPGDREVCGECNGSGKVLAGGLRGMAFTQSEMAEDFEFAEDYFGGRYDTTCPECGGRNVVECIAGYDDPRWTPELKAAAESHHEGMRIEAEFARMEAWERKMGC